MQKKTKKERKLFTLDALSDILSDYVKQFEESPYFDEDVFTLPKALLTICNEIKKIKQALK